MLGLALSVGVVIDDAIVGARGHLPAHGGGMALRHARAAGEAALRDPGTAVMATTLSLVIIFLPVGLHARHRGRRFLKGIRPHRGLRHHGEPLRSAFTLTPMLCSRFLKIQHGPKSKMQLWVDRLNDYLKERYGRMVEWSMRRRGLMVAIAVLTIPPSPAISASAS
ncbi:MAG: efflux RND transporter permease subunit [Elusimicrobia bacterium]|nr:efflux RND transporter permease subunit [Elusimicrobiota bacterium]